MSNRNYQGRGYSSQAQSHEFSGHNNYYEQRDKKEDDPHENNWRSNNYTSQQGRGLPPSRARGRGYYRKDEGYQHKENYQPVERKADTRSRGQYVTPTRDTPEEYLKIVGTCREMCPESERALREREGLLHKFEIDDSSWPVESGTNIGVQNDRLSQRSFGRKSLPKGDVSKIIKSFARSAAGQDKTLPKDLRPISVLKDTVKYLCTKILSRTDTPFNVVYDFIFDRLRAVRQDLVIQRIETKDAINILETIVKFHIYCDFRLREESVSIYDPHINQKHLTDCLRKLLSLYEFGKYNEKSRAEFEALNCLVSPNSYDVISRAIAIRKTINSNLMEMSIDIALSYQCKNFTRFFRKVSKLPNILQMYCKQHVSIMRCWAFESFCIAYGVNTCKIPLSWITTQLQYPSISSTHKELGILGIEIIRDEANNEKYAKFLKSHRSVISSKATGISSHFSSSVIQTFIQDKSNSSISQLCLCF